MLWVFQPYHYDILIFFLQRKCTRSPVCTYLDSSYCIPEDSSSQENSVKEWLTRHVYDMNVDMMRSVLSTAAGTWSIAWDFLSLLTRSLCLQVSYAYRNTPLRDKVCTCPPLLLHVDYMLVLFKKCMILDWIRLFALRLLGYIEINVQSSCILAFTLLPLNQFYARFSPLETVFLF